MSFYTFVLVRIKPTRYSLILISVGQSCWYAIFFFYLWTVRKANVSSVLSLNVMLISPAASSSYIFSILTWECWMFLNTKAKVCFQKCQFTPLPLRNQNKMIANLNVVLTTGWVLTKHNKQIRFAQIYDWTLGAVRTYINNSINWLHHSQDYNYGRCLWEIHSYGFPVSELLMSTTYGQFCVGVQNHVFVNRSHSEDK